MENFFARLFEDVRNERFLILLLSLTDERMYRINIPDSRTVKETLYKTLIWKSYIGKNSKGIHRFTIFRLVFSAYETMTYPVLKEDTIL